MRVAVIGAGLAGLAAARQLAEQHTVVVFDKGRSVGGRLATRRIGDATFDHGAQFFTVRGAALQTQVNDWLSRRVARVWCHGFDSDDGYPRYIGTTGMNSLAKDLAIGLDVRLRALVFTIRDARLDPDEAPAWDVVTDDGVGHRFDGLVLTCPVPQAWSLLAQSGVELPESMIHGPFARTLAVLAVLDGPSAIPSPGALQFLADAHPVFSFIADNCAKGISAVPALTLHANAAFSREHWDEPNEMIVDDVLAHAQAWIDPARVTHAELKRWRLATPLEPWPEPCWLASEQRVVLAGDGFAGPKFEGAYNSGVAAAVVLGTVLAGGGA